MTGLKLKTTVWPDDIIQLPTGDEYKLCGIGHHMGDYHGQGHFIASLKNDQSWFRCNDTDICNSNERDAKSLECNFVFTLKYFILKLPSFPQMISKTCMGGRHLVAFIIVLV
jgi:hypothetical protein